MITRSTDQLCQPFLNRPIRIDIADPRESKLILEATPSILNLLVFLSEKDRPDGGFRATDDEKFASPWRREGPLPERADSGFGGGRRRFNNDEQSAEPREPSASENTTNWRSTRPPPSRITPESDFPPKRRGSGFPTPSHDAEPSAADSEEKWTKGSKLKPSSGNESQPGSRYGSMRGGGGRGEMGPPPTPSTADEGPWRRAKPTESASR